MYRWCNPLDGQKYYLFIKTQRKQRLRKVNKYGPHEKHSSFSNSLFCSHAAAEAFWTTVLQIHTYVSKISETLFIDFFNINWTLFFLSAEVPKPAT